MNFEALNRETVMKHDPDRYLLSLFAPTQYRGALWALYAFNHEIAKTREVVTDTTMGLIRLQWWRDAIAEIYEGKEPRAHQVVTELAKAIKAYGLSRELFDNLIFAREFDLEGVAPANIEGLMKYCEFTNAPLWGLTLEIMGENVNQSVGQTGGNDTTLVDISKRYGLIGVIRSVPYMLSIRQVLLPQGVLSDFNISEEKLFNYKAQGDISKVIETLVVDNMPDVALKNSPKILKKVVQMTNIYEAQLRSVNFDVFHPKMVTLPKFMALRLWLGT